MLKYIKEVKVVVLLTFILISFTAKANVISSPLEDAQKTAIATNKLVLVDFWATWCGPCKKMDSESWSKDDVKKIMDAYVFVKIDIDHYPSIAKKYGVKGIPFVFIMDANGEVVYKQMSFMNKSQLLKLLKKYALNTSFLQKDFVIHYKYKNSNSSIRLAQAYQNYTIYLDEKIRSEFLTVSKIYLKKAKKFLKAEGKNDFSMNQKIELLFIQEKLFREKYKKGLKELNGFKEEDIDKKNKSFYYFLNYVVNMGLEDEKSSEVWLLKLKSSPSNKSYLIRAEKLFVQS